MNNKNNKSQLITIISIAIPALIMMYVNTLIGFIALAIVLGFNIYRQSYLLSVIKANKAYVAKDFETALEKYKKAISSKFVNASTIRGYVLIELKYGSAENAKNVLSDILKSRNFKSHELLALKVSNSLILWKLGNLDEAVNILKNLLENEKSTYIYETLTTLLLIDNRTEEALELIKEALKYDESNNILRSNFGEVNFKLGNFDIAEETFSTLINENILFIEPYYFYGLILKEKGENEKAIELLKQALDTNDSLLTTVSKADAKRILNELILIEEGA